MIQITLTNVAMKVVDIDDGGKAMLFQDDQSGMLVAVPLAAEAKDALVRALTGGLYVPTMNGINLGPVPRDPGGLT